MGLWTPTCPIVWDKVPKNGFFDTFPNLIFLNVSVSHEHVAQMYDGTEGWVAFRTEANRELLLCSCTNCSPRAIYSTFNSACSATCFSVICHLCVFCFSLVSQNPQVQGPLPCSLVSALFYAFLPKDRCHVCVHLHYF